MIDLKSLENAFAEIGKVGRGEETFPVAGVPVTVRALSDEENIQVWKFAAVALEEGEDAAAHQEWMHRMKVATLSYAIIQVGDSDLRDSLVATGDTLEDGRPITREKVEVVRQLLTTWGSAVLLRMYARFGEFVHRVEDRAEKAIVYEPMDYDAEISRLEERVTELRERKEGEARSRVDPLGQSIKQTLAHSAHELQGRRSEMESGVPLREAPEPPQEAPEAAPPPESPVASPEPPVVSSEELSEPPGYSEEQVRQSLRRTAEDPSGSGGIDPGSSFIDPSDPDTIQQIQAQQAALYTQKQKALEQHSREVATRQRQLEARRQGEGVAPVPVRSGRKLPPHARAAAVQASVQAGLRPPTEDGVPVFQLPTQTLSKRGESDSPKETPASVNPVSQGGVTNPKFKPPR